jgi:transposase
MRLRIGTNKNGSKNLYVIKSYRTDEGKSTSKVVESLGTYDALLKMHSDPIAWAKSYVEELNRKEKEDQLRISVSFSPTELIEKDSATAMDCGYLFLQKLFYQLRLDTICSNIAKTHRFKYNLTEILSHLIYGRILDPRSKLGTFEYCQGLLEKPAYKLEDIYRALEVIAKEKDHIQSELYKFSKDLGKRNDKILYYDCTNYYFEIEQEQGLRKHGISKENRPNPIVEMGLFMDADGIPLAFSLHSGNTNEQTTLKPLEEQIIRDFGHSRFVVCTDAGLSSIANRKFNNTANRAFITTQSLKQMKAFQKEWALSPEGWSISGDSHEYNLNDILSDPELCEKYRDTIFHKERWFNENKIEQRYIVSFSIKYRNYLRNIRNEQISRAQKSLNATGTIEKSKQTDYKRFITRIATTQDGEIAEQKVYVLNEDKIKEEEQYDGFYATATNLEDPAEQIIKINRNRWEIEESFRIMKSELKARPVFLRRDERIAAHFTICYLALVLYRYMEKVLDNKYTCTEIISGLRSMKLRKIKDEGYIPAYRRTDFTDSLHDCFGFRTDYEITRKSKMKEIIRSTKKR